MGRRPLWVREVFRYALHQTQTTSKREGVLNTCILCTSCTCIACTCARTYVQAADHVSLLAQYNYIATQLVQATEPSYSFAILNIAGSTVSAVRYTVLARGAAAFQPLSFVKWQCSGRGSTEQQ